MLTTATRHNAARWYCEDRWRRLHAAGSAGDGDFPYVRADVVENIRVEIERFVPGDFRDLAEAREFLAAAGETAHGLYIRHNPSGAEQLAAVAERRRYIQFVHRLDAGTAASAPALAYRRTLAAREAETIWAGMCARWHIAKDGYWYPLDAAAFSTQIHAFDKDPFEQDHVLQLLRSFLKARGIARVFEIREGPPHIEIDGAAFEPIYSGLEGYWSSPGYDWIAYASHEWSVTIGGWMLDDLKAAWPDWQLWPYTYPS